MRVRWPISPSFMCFLNRRVSPVTTSARPPMTSPMPMARDEPAAVGVLHQAGAAADAGGAVRCCETAQAP